MTDFTEITAWSGVTQLETTDKAKGGAGGKANMQAQQLANRDAYLNSLIADMQMLFADRTVGLVLKNNASNPNTQIDLQVTHAFLKHATLAPLRVSAANVTGNISTIGANGLDSGTKSNSTWYAVWLISEGINTRLLFSLSFSNPTLPTDFVYKSPIGQVKVDPFGNIVKFFQYQRTVYFQRQSVLFGAQATTSNVFQSLNVANQLPPNAIQVMGMVGSNSLSNGDGWVRVASDAYGSGQSGGNSQQFGAGNNGLSPAMVTEYPFCTGISVPQTIFWTQGSATSATACIDLTGYSF